MKGAFNQGWWNCFGHFAAELLGVGQHMDDLCVSVLKGAGIAKREASYWLEHSDCPHQRGIDVVRQY